MNIQEFKAILHQCPLIASVQADPGTPLDNPEALVRLAEASLEQGVRLLRMQGVANLEAILRFLGNSSPPGPLSPKMGERKQDSPPVEGWQAKPDGVVSLERGVIGLIKSDFPGSKVYITPTVAQARQIARIGCAVVATDATLRIAPDGSTFADRAAAINAEGKLCMADCDSLEAALAAEAAGADVIGTTLAGYTAASSTTDGPDLELLRAICEKVGIPVLAEGRYSQKWQVDAALRIGASGVVVGGALNDPIKQTRALMPRQVPTNLAAFDIGGTWMRLAQFDKQDTICWEDKQPNPQDGRAVIAWLKQHIQERGIGCLGVSTAGILDPKTGEVWRAKENLMPNYVGTTYNEATLGILVKAHGDGHATAWGHACLPQYAGKPTATLTIGTGVGCGFVAKGEIWAGSKGEYPRINDSPCSLGGTIEDHLAGIHLGHEPTLEQQSNATRALQDAVELLHGLYFPDVIVLSGTVGTQPWLAPTVQELGLHISPFRSNAGLYGAAALAKFA